VTRRINKVEDILLPVCGVDISHLDGVAFDRDPALALQIHVIQGLVLHIAIGDRVGMLEEPIGQGAFAVVNVGDNTKIADVLHERSGKFGLNAGWVCLVF
jgi:hypothetical protein